MSSFFFFNDTATTEIYTLSLHDALPICSLTGSTGSSRVRDELKQCALVDDSATRSNDRSEVKNGPSWLRTRRRSQMFKHQVRSLGVGVQDRKSTRLNSSHLVISYAVFCL